MINQTDNVFDLNAVLHPTTAFDHPRDVIADATLSLSEKRAILASWGFGCGGGDFKSRAA